MAHFLFLSFEKHKKTLTNFSIKVTSLLFFLFVLILFLLTAISPFFVSQKTKEKRNLTRKLFHVSMFFSVSVGVLFNKEQLRSILMYMFLFSLLVEFLRQKTGFLSSYMCKFEGDVDKKQIVSYTSFVFGCSFPIWALNLKTTENIFLLSGIIPVCVGDVFSSIVGIRYGRNRIKKKSIEGFISFFVSTFVCCIVFCWKEKTVEKIIVFSIVSIFSAVCELLSTQNDNLNVPCVFYLSLLIGLAFVNN